MTTSGFKAHSELGASAADRWMACPGSVRMSRGIKNTDTPYTLEGTAAHTLCEKVLEGPANLSPYHYVGTQIDGIDVTDEMAEAVEVYVNYCRTLAAIPGAIVQVEQRFDLAKLNPPAPMFGTSDFNALDVVKRHLTVVDFKYGKGHAVDVIGNPQLQYYGLGALLSAGVEYPVDTVTLVIVQPRASHPDGIIRSYTLPIEQLVDFAGELMQRARATMAPDAPLFVGEHCRFCRAQAKCPAQLKKAEEIAQTEFTVPGRLPSPPNPDALTIEQVVRILDNADIIESWIKEVRRYALNEIEAGRGVPGYKRVARRATRKWISEASVVDWASNAGVSLHDIFDKKLKSPAQVEKLVGSTLLPLDLIIKESSGFNLAPEDDRRPAVAAGPAEEFGVAATD